MQRLIEFQDSLRAIRPELISGTIERQDRALTRWHQRLNMTAAQEHPSWYLPSYYRGLCVSVLERYQTVVPHRLQPPLSSIVSAAVQETISRLNAHKKTTEPIEEGLGAFLRNVRNKHYPTAAAFCRAFGEMLGVSLASVQKDRHFEQRYREFRDAPFIAPSVVAFLTETLLHRLPEPLQTSSSRLELLLWDQLAYLLYPSAALVDLATEQADILRFEMIAEASTATEKDGITFKDEVDETMRRSCEQALRAARRHVETVAPRALDGKKILITCRFQHPLKTYGDTSISLLMAIKAIGDLLELEQHPDMVISGELDEHGVIRPVGFLQQKIEAVERRPNIRRMILPADGHADSHSNLQICRVRNLKEAVKIYYGAALKPITSGLSRRAFLSGIIGFGLGAAAATATATATSSLPFAAQNLFAHSVTEHDWQLAEYARIFYQMHSDHAIAIKIFQEILGKFKGNNKTEAKRLTAICHRNLGVIYLQQHRIRDSLRAMRNAVECWQAIDDRENQADVFLSLGEIYRYRVGIEGRTADAQKGIAWYQRAFNLLEKRMPSYQKRAGQYYALTGCLYDELGEFDRAEQFGRRSMEIFEPIETNWTYQTCRQHVGRILTHAGKHDDAHDIIASTMQAAVLQSPYYQVRSYWTLADLRLSTEDVSGGLDALRHAEQLCQQHGFSGQRRMINKIAAQHGVQL